MHYKCCRITTLIYGLAKKFKKYIFSRTCLERQAIEHDSCVDKKYVSSGNILSTTGHVKPCGNLPEPSGKAKYFLRPIVN